MISEGERFGLTLGGGTAPPVFEPGYLEGMRAMAGEVLKLQQAIEQLRSIQVGYSVIYDPETGMEVGETPVNFNAESKPDRPPRGNESPPLATWEETKTQHDRVSAVVSGFASLYPALHVLIGQERIEELVNAGDSAQALTVVDQNLRHALVKIDETDVMVATEDIAYYDLVPLHAQLFAGSPGVAFVSTYPWEQPFFATLAKDVLADQEAREFWATLGLSLLAAAALIAAPFTGGASAAFLVGFGVGLGIGQAAVSWERYLDLAAASEATVRDELSLVSQGQVTAALVGAIMDTVGVFLDAYGARGLGAAERATRQAAFEVAERELRERLIREARERAVRGAATEGAMAVGGAGLAIAGHELLGQEPEIEATVEQRVLDLPADAAAASSAGLQRRAIMRSNGGSSGTVVTPGPTHPPVVTGDDFEMFVERALKRGEIPGMPQMDFVIPGQYTGSGWGVDRVGIVIDDATGKIDVYHCEMKFQIEPTLGRPGAGTQTGAGWTSRAIDGLMTSQHPKARAVRERLRRAMQRMHPGATIDINVMRSFLELRLSNAPVRIFVPHVADLSRLWRQIAGLARWGRDVRPIRVKVP